MRHTRNSASRFATAGILIAGLLAILRLAELAANYAGWSLFFRAPAHQVSPFATKPPVQDPKAQTPSASPLPPRPARCAASQVPAGPAPQAPASSSLDYGGEPIGLGRGYLEGERPTYSPDGREIAFVKELPRGYRIWITGVDGHNLRQLRPDTYPDPVFKDGSSGGRFDEGGPAWSPGGSRIAFVSNAFGKFDIWTVGRDGSNPIQLTKDLFVVSSPNWSPKGTELVFAASRSTRSRDIWIVSADGTDQRRVTNLTGFENDPAFSPDGNRIVFMSTDDPASNRSRSFHLMIINRDGTGLCQLTTGEVQDYQPNWSSRGIVFYRAPLQGGMCCSLWLVQADGSELESLPTRAGNNPVWSPDGNRIAFDDSEHIYVFRLNDRTIKPLTQFNAISIVVYIKPGFANTVNPKTEVRIPVAILSAPWFDPVGRIDRASITFGPAGSERAPASCAADEVNQDGAPDLVCLFDVGARFSVEHTEGVLKAKDVSGLFYEGRDSVRVLSTP